METHPGNEAASVTLRDVGSDDDDFLLRVYASTRADELAHVPWDETQKNAFLQTQFSAQQQHYQSRYPEGEHQIILLEEKPVGRIYLARLEQEIRILDVTILPEQRNAGIGTWLLKDLLAEAAKTEKPVRIVVENFNPSLRLFERLGFSKIDDDGLNILLEW